MSDSSSGFEGSEAVLEAGLGADDLRKSRPEERPESKTLTEKMLYLMEKISEYGYLTIKEVGLVYSNQTHAYRVLNVLKEKGLLADFRTTLAPRTAFYLTRKGYWLLEQNERLKVESMFRPQHFQIQLFRHRMACATAGLILESHPFIHNYTPESLLWARKKSPRQKVCDGEFWFKSPGQHDVCRVGLEVELTLKNSRKLVDSFRDLKRRADIDHVWWICGDKAVSRAVAANIRDMIWLAPQGHFLVDFEELLKNKYSSPLIDRDYNAYSIDPEELNWPPKPGVSDETPEEVCAGVHGDEDVRKDGKGDEDEDGKEDGEGKAGFEELKEESVPETDVPEYKEDRSPVGRNYIEIELGWWHFSIAAIFILGILGVAIIAFR